MPHPRLPMRQGEGTRAQTHFVYVSILLGKYGVRADRRPSSKRSTSMSSPSEYSEVAMKLPTAIASISTTIGLCCATSIALTQPANVPSVPATVYEQFNMMDSNGDSKVSALEHANGTKKM